ncbi:DUF4347 domain-containing protein [Cyanobacteria bacterium FACHB-DQ100]|nr:DUF4347 domain-containing protein [Cyanobacteria bacterium FACHB-DQ100]
MSSDFNRASFSDAKSFKQLTTSPVELQTGLTNQSPWANIPHAFSLSTSQQSSLFSGEFETPSDTTQGLEAELRTGSSDIIRQNADRSFPIVPWSNPTTSTPNSVAPYTNWDQELFFVDSTVEDAASLLAGISSNQIIYLNAAQDGVEQITEALAQRQGISAIHIISHGDSGSLRLGNADLSGETLDRYRDSLQAWKTSLTDDADILIYGCDVAAGEQGQAVITQISQLTGADVAASDDLTGTAALGGDWILEFGAGTIDTSALSNIDYQHILATASLTNGKFVYSTTGETDVEKNQLTVSISGSNLVVTDNDQDAYSIGISGSDIKIINTYSVSVVLSAITSFEINTGNSDDTIVLSSDFSSFLSAVNISINTGMGSDTITFDTAVNTQGGTLLIETGDDGDTITFNQAVDTKGASFSINSGSGEDTITVNAAISTQGGTFAIETGDDGDTITFNQAVDTKGASFSINSGSGEDTITVNAAISTQGGTFAIETGDDGDTITFNQAVDTKAGSFSLSGGGGNDTFNISNTILTAGGTVSLGGGDGSDTFNVSNTISTTGGAFTISGDSGNDTATINASVYTQGGNLSIEANTLTVKAGNNLSTRNTSGADHSTATSTGNSGAISLTGEQITIGSKDSTLYTGLYSQVETGSTYKAGDIKISVSETALTTLDPTDTSNATINLNKVILKGNNVTFSATADYAQTFDDSSSVADWAVSFLDNYSLVGGGAVSKSTATITADYYTQITGADVSLSASATTEAIIQPLFSYILGAAYAKADSTATVTFAGKITATSNVSISTLTDSTVNAQSSTSKWDSSNAVTNSAASAAITELYSNSTAQITDQASISAGGNVSVTAKTIDRNYTNTKSSTSSNGTLAVAAAVSLEDGSTNALMDGQVTAGGSITVEASQKNEDIQSILTGGGSLTSGSGVSAVAGVSDLKGDVLSGIQSSVGAGLWSAIASLGSSESSQASSKTKGKTSSFQIGAAFAYIDDTNNVTARIGDTYKSGETSAANVMAKSGSIAVNATAEYRPNVTASSMLDDSGSSSSSSDSSSSSSGSSSSTSSSSFAGSAGVAIGDYTNNVSAYIGSSATVNAYKSLSVTANTLNNYSVQWGVNLVEPFTETGDWQTKAGTFVSNLTGYLNNNLGLDNYIFDSWSQATASAESKLAAAGAVTVLSLDHTSKAYIDQNAKINQDTTLRSDQQTVTVESNSINESVHFGGNIALPGVSWNGKTSSANFSIGGAGASASNAVGGTVLVLDYINDVSARIEDGVTLYADSLKVNADSKTMSIDIAASGGKADKFGFNGAGTWVFADNTTTAQIDDGVTLVVGDNLVSGSTASLVVNAEDTSDVINVMGGISVSDSIGMGVTVGFNTIDRNTRAVIGNLSGSGETDQTTSISSSGNVKVNAKNNGYIGSFSLASAISTGGDVTNHSDGTTTGSTSYGVGISGDVAFNEVTDTTEAYLRDVKVTTTNQSTVSVTANNDSEIMAIGGSVALTIGNNYKSTSSLGLAGSYGQNIVSQTTNAYLENTTLTNPKTFTVTATNTSEIYAVVAGGSGAANSDLNTGIAGAVTINEITNTTKAYIANSTTTIAGAITVSATDSSTLHADAGGVALAIAFKPESNAASLSAGVGVSVNDVTNTVSAYVDKSTLTAAGNVAVTATSTGTIDAFALGGAASVSSNASLMAFSFSGAGAGADNDIENTISAYVTNSSTITTSNSGTISITATDNSTITADSGGYSIAFSRSSASASGSVGVAIANNDIQNTISAYVDQSTLTSTGAVDITAQSTAEIDALSIGGSAAGSSGDLGSLSISGAGAGTTNSIDNKISAQVKNTATITTSNNAAVTVKATDGSLITADAGGVAISGTLGNGSSASLSIGASIATNKIGLERGHTIQALVDNATINAAGNVGLTASSTATIDGLAFSGAAAVSGSTGGGNISLAGSGTGIENTIKATIAAGIQNGGKVTTVETVTLTATDDSEITADAGAASLAIGVSGDGSGAVSIGVAIANNEINNTVKAFVDKGTVTAGDLNLSASSSALIDTKGIAGAVSVAASGGASLSGAGAGTGVTNTLRNTIQSYIQNGSTITTKTDANNGGDLNLSAIDDSTIESVAIGGSIAISGSTGAAFSLAIGAVTVTNTIDNTVQSFIGQNATDSTSISAGDDIALTAQSRLTMTQNTAVAASLSVGVAPTSASFSGAGASVTTTTTSDIAAFIRNVNTSTNGYNVQAADVITLTANDASNLDPTVGSGVLVASMVGASVGVSITDTTVNNTVQAYIDNAKVSSTNGNLSLTATSSPDIDALAVATSVAASIGGAGAGAEATATVKSTVEARIGSGSSVKAKTIDVVTDSTDDITTDAYGASAGVVAIGAAIADSKTQSITKAHVTGATITATNLNISSTGDGKVDAGVMSLAGGVWASGAGNSADATFDSTVQAYIGDSTTVTLTGNLNITATAQPDADATAFGLSVSGLLQAGYSAATAEVTPQIDAYIGNGSTISASNLTLLAQQSLSTGGDAAYAKATGSGGALFGSLNASESTATNSGQVSAYVGKYSNLTITNTASIKADADSQQTAEADGYNAGALALGNNIASAESSLTTQAYLDNGVNVTAKDLKIQAIGNDYNYANAIAGGGGVVSGRAATGSTDNASTAKVRIEDGDTTSGNVEIKISNAIDILADQTTKFNSKSNSVNASVVGGSGAYTENTVNSTASVTIGTDTDNTVQNLVINAASLTVNANQTILKPELVDETAESASGGVIDAPAASSTTTINNSTTITIGDSSTSNNFDTTISTTGDITLNALNTVYAWDDTLLDSGGVVSVARSDSKVEQKTNEAMIAIQDANLYSDGEITLSARAEVEFDVTASASSYGVAGVPSAYSTATTNTKNQIQLKNGAYLRSEKDVNLLAGQNADGDTNAININARSNVWNYTAAPISSAGSSDASVTLENTITIDAGAQILTVNDANLLTTEGDVEAVGVLKSQDGYEELVGNLTGASVADIERTADDIRSTTGVTVNGTVEVSIENQETLTIDESLNLTSKTTVDGVSVYPINITQQTDGIGTVTLSVENVYNTISQRILQLKELKAAYAGDVSTVASYTSEIEYWETKLAELGSVTQVTYIEVPDITVKVGDIRVTGDYLKGSGLLNSPGDAKIFITNGSPYYLRVNDLTIPEIAGGRILFNTASVTSNATINSRNTSGNTANFSQVTTSANSDEALISVENTYDPTFAVQKSQFTALGVSTPAAPDLEVLGSVSNFKGTVRLTNDEGSIVVTGSLNAKTIDIDSGSDFVLSDNGTVFEFNPSSKVSVSNNTITIASHGLKTGEQVFYQNGGGTSIGGLTNARSYFTIVVDSNTIKLASTETDASANKAIDLTSAGSGTQSLSLTDDLGFLHVGGDPRSQLSGTASTYEIGSATTGSSSVDPSSTSSITASNNVFINARYLNINGVIQSGIPDRSLTLSDTLNSTIFGFKFSYDLTKEFGGTSSTKYLTLSTDTDGTGIDAKYNAETNRIELDNVSIEGGYMQLTGHILSTGDGNLKVMDGFGRINIVNNTSFDIALNSIDTGGSGIEGKLKIIDTARTGADGEALVTTYTHVGNNVTITDTSISGGKTTTTSNSRSASYSPLANQRYTWVTGQSSLTETVKTYAKSNVWGIDELAKDPGTEIESHTTLLDETPLLEGTYVETGTSSNLYNYSREVVTTSNSQLVDQDTWTTTSGWWVFKSTTYYRRDTYQKGQKTINTHSYKADSPIAVTFVGYDTGSVSVTSTSNILILDSVTNEGGTTTLKSTSGYIDNLSTTGTITSNSLVLSGSKLEDLKTDVNQLQFTVTGDVSITDTAGDVTISGESYSSSGKVTLSTEGSLLSAGAGTYDIKGYTIDLTSESGSIGSSTRSVRVNSGIKTNATLSTADGVSGVTLDAADDIYLEETDGDLYLVSAKAGNNVTLNVTKGGLIDNNLSETLDPYSQTQLESLWSQVGLTTDRSSKAIASFKQQAEQLYDTYWNYRNVKSSVNGAGQTVYTADDYNANFAYSYSDTAKAQLRTLGYTDSAITAMAAEKTAQYHTLHQLFSDSSVTLTGDEAYMSTVITDLFKDSDFTGKNLTIVSTYSPTLIESKYNVSTSQQSSLSQGGKWSLDQLKNTVAAGLFGSVTDTQYMVEDPNITAGGDVTITTSGGVGRAEGTVVIDNWSSIKNWATDLTEAQRLALSYAERDDITYYDASGNKISDLSKSGTSIAKVSISLKQDVDINTTGEINLTAGGNVFLGSEQDINLDQIKAGSEVRIKATKGLVNVAASGAVNVISGGDLVLEAGSASIGTSTTPITIDLKDNAYYYNGKLYLLSSSATWETAQTYAQSLGGNLITINDATEEAWLKSTFGSTEGFWIGLTDKATEGTFAWANGETTTYRNWAAGEPNNSNNEDYVSMNFGGNRQWNDSSSTATMRGIIELSVQEYNGHFYLLNPTATWETAQTAAQALGGALITINDATEEAWLKSTFGSTEGFWIGLTDKATEGTFAWANGETTTYRNWAAGEPNNSNNEDYVSMNFGGNRQWNDSSSTATMRGIVEIGSLGANLTARAKTDIYVANSGNLNISEVYAGNILSLSSTGGIIDASNNADANLQSDFLMLTAPSAGTSTNAVDFADDTEVKLNTTQNVYLQTPGDLSVDVLGRTSGSVNITGDSSNNIITLYSSSDSLNSTIDISVNGGSGSDTLIVKPTRTGGTWDQTNRTITGTGLGTIAYSNIETVKITPVAGNDSATTTEATSTTFTVLGNDVDFYPANAIAISEIGGSSVTAGQTVTLTSGALVTFNANNSFTYNPNGKFEFIGVGKTATDTFTYGVTNSSSGTDTATVTVTIAGINDAPTGIDDSPATDEATTLTISALSNDFDTDMGDTLSITHVNGTAISAGSILTLASGAKVTFNADGTFSYNPNGKFEYLGIGKTATDSFQYTISDGKGGTSTATINLTITGVNDAPTAKADSVTTTENSTVTFAVLGNDSDIDVGDILSVTKINGVMLSAGSSVLIDSKAKVTLNANGTLTYDPNGKFEYLGKSATGTDSFTYTISDSKGGISTATINLTITGENDAPTANADSVTTNEDSSTTFSILSNDSDIDTGDTISISRINGKIMVPGSTITLTSGAKLTYNTNRTFTYNPNGKFAALNMGDTATDSFTYTIVDGKGGSSTATATITIKGGSFFERTGSSNPFNGVDVGYNSNITFADLDKDGDLDAFMAASEGIRYYQNTNGSFTQVTGTSNLLNGVYGASISFADIDKDGDLDAFVGDVKSGINYYQNNNGRFSLVTGASNPFNNISDTIAPSFIDIDNDGDLDAFAGSIDGTIKFYRNTNGSFAQVTGSAHPFNGLDFGDDASISFADVDLDGDLDAFIGRSTGLISYYSNTNGSFAASSGNPFNGVDVGQNATIAFADINGDGDLDAFIGEFDGNFNYFENVNTAPVASADSTTTNEDTAITFSTLSNDSDANVADTLSITKVNGASMTAGSSISLTSGAKVTLNANKTFTYSPNGKFEYLGSGKSAMDSFTYSISDGRGGISTATVSLTITGVNDAPVTVADSATTDEDTTTTISVLSNDYDMDADTFSITQVNGAAISSGSTITLGSGAKLTINSNGTFTYNPNGKFSSLQSGATGSDSFTYTISDGKGGTSTATVSLSITGLTFRERTGTANPFTGLDVGDKATPAFADIDKDGDLDAFVGSSDGTIRYYRNTNGSFTQVTGTANPFNGITWGNNSSISFADIDRDGDLDAFISGTKGGIGYYQNTNGVFTLNTNTTLFPGLTSTTNAPTFADIDGDGDLDAFITNASSSSSTTGSIAFYRNTNGSFTQVTGTANPFNGMSIGVNTRYDFADLDKDGDLDMFVGDDKVGAAYYRNTNGSFSYESGANPFANISGIGSTSAIIFADIDKDGDSDAIFGQQDGTLKYLENK